MKTFLKKAWGLLFIPLCTAVSISVFVLILVRNVDREGWFISLLFATILGIASFFIIPALILIWWRIFTPEGREVEQQAQEAWKRRKENRRRKSIFNLDIPIVTYETYDTDHDSDYSAPDPINTPEQAKSHMLFIMQWGHTNGIMGAVREFNGIFLMHPEWDLQHWEVFRAWYKDSIDHFLDNPHIYTMRMPDGLPYTKQSDPLYDPNAPDWRQFDRDHSHDDDDDFDDDDLGYDDLGDEFYLKDDFDLEGKKRGSRLW